MKYSFPNDQLCSDVCKRLKEKGFMVSDTTLTSSGYPQVTTNAAYSIFAQIYEEATGLNYEQHLLNLLEPKNKK